MLPILRVYFNSCKFLFNFMSDNSLPTMKKASTGILNRILMTFITVVIIAIMMPVLILDVFTVSGDSMRPTLKDGERVMVNKLLFGARIYTRFNFMDPDLESFRMPGLRDIRPGDILIFNSPYPDSSGEIHFRINHVLAKRCIGTPGDTVSIKNGFFVNSSIPGEIIGLEKAQRWLARRPDSVLLTDTIIDFHTVMLPGGRSWTIKNFGPMLIPAKGNSIVLSDSTAALYGRLIEYETGSSPIKNTACFTIDGSPLTEYTFQSDWYFMAGDNLTNSRDSRYYGPVPGDFIVGIVPGRQ